MKQYLLSIYQPEGTPAPDVLAPIMRNLDALNQAGEPRADLLVGRIHQGLAHAALDRMQRGLLFEPRLPGARVDVPRRRRRVVQHERAVRRGEPAPAHAR